MNVPLMEFAMKHNGSLSSKNFNKIYKLKESPPLLNKISISKPFMPMLTNGHPGLKVSQLVIFGNTMVYEELFKAK